MSAPEFDWTDFAREVAARNHAERSVEAEAALANARYVIEQEELERKLSDPERDHWRRLWMALMLAQDAETLDALLAGERVPLDRLDPEWVARFELRRRK